MYMERHFTGARIFQFTTAPAREPTRVAQVKNIKTLNISITPFREGQRPKRSAALRENILEFQSTSREGSDLNSTNMNRKAHKEFHSTASPRGERTQYFGYSLQHLLISKSTLPPEGERDHQTNGHNYTGRKKNFIPRSARGATRAW